MPPRKRLGQLLTELGVIDEHQLQSALGHQKQWGGKLGGILVQKGFCTEDAMVETLAKHLGMPRVRIADAKIDPRALKTVSKQIAEKLHVFPYEISGSGRSEVVTIAMSDPTDLSAVDQLAFHTGKRIKPMLAGDTEVLGAIQTHYGASEEKKEPTDKLKQPAPAAAAPARPSTPPAAAAPRAAPYVPPPIPAGQPAAPPQKLEEIEPDEVMAPPAAPVPVDLPEDDAQDLGLEPIAAHSQFGDQVAGQEDIAAGEGNAGDAVEGLVSASLAHEISPPSQVDAGWESQPAASDPAWDAPPAAAPAAAWDAPQQDWGAPAHDAPAAPESAGEELPPDAILGAAGGPPVDMAPAETGWDVPSEPAAESEVAAHAAEQRAPAMEPPPLPDLDALPRAAAAPAEEELEDSVPIDEDFDDEPEAPAIEPPAPAMEAEQAPAMEAEPAPAMETEPAPEPAHEAEAPDAWGATEDPLAAQGGDAPAWGDVPQQESADHRSPGASTQEFANPTLQDQPESADQPATDVASVDEAAYEDFEAMPDPGEPPVESPEERTQRWAALPGEGDEQRWAAEALDSPPLSRADLSALASIGVEPGDGVGALRLLAAMVRIMNRHQLIDPEELASEIRESREQAAASVGAAAHNGVEPQAESGVERPAAEPAET